MKHFSELLLVILLIGNPCLCQETIQDFSLLDSLVAYYPFNGSADDASGNGHHGTVFGAVLSEDHHGEQYAAYRFDGIDDYIHIGTHKDLQITGDLTVSLWMNAHSFAGIVPGLVSCQGDNDEYPQNNALYRVYFRFDGSSVSYYHESDSGTDHILEFTEDSLHTDEWYHIAVVRYVSEQAVTVYINGEYSSTLTYEENPSDGSSASLRIGESHGTIKPERFFNGSIDEVRIYNRALESKEITSLYGEKIKADFIADVRVGTVPLTVRYTDLSTRVDSLDTIRKWAWNFDGDSTIDSEEQNPEWTYTESGLYTVRLYASDSLYSDMEVKKDYIAVLSESPCITSIADIPNDQGGWVKINFLRSIHDSDSLQNKIESVEVYTIELDDGSGWTAGTSLVAYGKRLYSALVHTTRDFTADEEGIIKFRVIAGMEEGNFVSDIVSGYSLDNLAPGAPANIMAALEEGSSRINLYWDDPQDKDVASFYIYRNTENYFSSDSKPIFQTATNSFTDSDIENGQTYYYALKSEDRSGNRSDYSEVVSISLNSINGAENGVPDIFYLSQNYPNPFNPVTKISYGLPLSVDVRITIYDVLGRVVEILVNETQPAGRYRVEWAGGDQSGTRVSSGMYICKIEAGAFIKENRMILIR